MRFLLDENVSHRICPHLKAAGHDAVHVTEIGLTSADDQVVLGRARDQDRVLVSCDHDFVQLLFASGDTRPSVILVREAGIVAIADQYAHKKLGFINPALYRLEQEHAPGLVDVTKGSNTVSFTQGGKTITIKGYRARPGYDLVTGAGTIDAARFVPELARTG